MKTFFEKNCSGSSSTDDEYDFKPIKGDETDSATKDLFEQLEEGANQYTCIFDTIKEGANLYAKKTQGDYKGSFPIHIAAYNVDCNTEAISSILQSFDDPEKRKAYIFKKNGEGKNALEILIENAGIDEELALPSILSILSYLTDNEQRELINSLSKKAKRILEDDGKLVSRPQDIANFAGLNYFFNQKHKTIDTCRQRRDEAEKALVDYDSDEESLGQLDSVSHKKFTARVSYKDIIKKGIVVQSIPELVLIPSDWRLETALKSEQGDHVTAYVLLLSSFSHCKGENVKKLPELIYNLAVSVLPDDKKFFLKEKEKNDKALESHRKIRVETIASLKAHGNKEDDFLQAVENTLKKAEIELIARHIEDGVDRFITKINQLDDESFSHDRKAGLSTNYILQQLIAVLETVTWLKEKEYWYFKTILCAAIKTEAETSSQKSVGITDQTLKNIAGMVLKSNLKVAIPPELLSKSNKLTSATLCDFLKRTTPFKRYHEGYAINDIQNQISKLKSTTNQNHRNELLTEIGFLCFKLFDYPRVNDNRLNNETVLYQALPRHLIIINAAFRYLNEISFAEKELIYDRFLANILLLQGWGSHQISQGKFKMPLSLNLLKEKILEFAHLDADHNFSIKPKLLNQNNQVVRINSNF